mmetsp:Transcript_1702/g.10482  ORF Transcript_1702/g.10482 Transcript_1702/m.10482 type:complete len:243 (-) Transcript_1702:1931-2659(-)
MAWRWWIVRGLNWNTSRSTRCMDTPCVCYHGCLLQIQSITANRPSFRVQKHWQLRCTSPDVHPTRMPSWTSSIGDTRSSHSTKSCWMHTPRAKTVQKSSTCNVRSWKLDVCTATPNPMQTTSKVPSSKMGNECRSFHRAKAMKNPKRMQTRERHHDGPWARLYDTVHRSRRHRVFRPRNMSNRKKGRIHETSTQTSIEEKREQHSSGCETFPFLRVDDGTVSHSDPGYTTTGQKKKHWQPCP